MKTKHRYGTGNVVKKGPWYYARFFSRVQGKVIDRATKESDKAKAKTVLRRLIERDHAQAGGFIAPSSSEAISRKPVHRHTFSEIWNAWVMDVAPIARTESTYYALWKHLEDFCRRNHVERVSAINKPLAKSFQEHLSKTYASSSVFRHVAFCSQVWSWAINQGSFGLSSNQWKGLKGRVQIHSKESFTNEQVMDSSEHRLFMDMRKGGEASEPALSAFHQTGGRQLLHQCLPGQ